MHIDWIATNAQLNTNKFPGCGDPTVPCVFNLTVLPSLPAPGIRLLHLVRLHFQLRQPDAAHRHASWGVSVKQTAGVNVSYGDALSGGSVGIKNSTQYAHNHNVAQTYDTYKAQTDSVNSTTGFADHIFYTERAMNVYYYPVLAASSVFQQRSQLHREIPDVRGVLGTRPGAACRRRRHRAGLVSAGP